MLRRYARLVACHQKDARRTGAAFTPARIELARPSSQSSFTTITAAPKSIGVSDELTICAEHYEDRRRAGLLSASNSALQQRLAINQDQLLGLSKAVLAPAATMMAATGIGISLPRSL